MFGMLPNAFGDMLYQWNFNSTDGANTGTGSGGTLTANVGGATTGNFSGTGVSGNVGDSSLYTFDARDSYWGSGFGNAAGIGNVDLTGLTQFTITMWVKRSGSRDDTMLSIGSTTTPDGSSNPGIALGLSGNWHNGVSFGVNGSTEWSNGNLWGGYTSDWMFMAFTYTATEGSWWSPTFGGIYFGGANQPGNAAILLGGINTSVTVAQGFHIGGAADNPGSVALGSTASVFLGNYGAGDNGFSGNLDDVRIYNSLLTVSQIDAVRLDALQPAPEPSTMALAAMGGAALLFLRRRTVR